MDHVPERNTLYASCYFFTHVIKILICVIIDIKGLMLIMLTSSQIYDLKKKKKTQKLAREIINKFPKLTKTLTLAFSQTPFKVFHI